MSLPEREQVAIWCHRGDEQLGYDWNSRERVPPHRHIERWQKAFLELPIPPKGRANATGNCPVCGRSVTFEIQSRRSAFLQEAVTAIPGGILLILMAVFATWVMWGRWEWSWAHVCLLGFVMGPVWIWFTVRDHQRRRHGEIRITQQQSCHPLRGHSSHEPPGLHRDESSGDARIQSIRPK